MSSLLLAWLVILCVTVLTLEIQRHLFLARVIGVMVMLIAWQFLLPSELQLKAASCAVVYHGIAEGVRQWQRNFPCVFEHRKDRKIVLWLLFWSRAFTWGAAIGGVAAFVTLLKSREERRKNLLCCCQEAVALAIYYEVMEVLLMLYFSKEELPYVWQKRIGHWLAALLVGFLESTGRLDAVLRGPLLVDMSPLAVVVVLLIVMWLSIEIPWDQIAKVSSPYSGENEEHDKMQEFERNRKVEKYASTFSVFRYISRLFCR